MERDQIHYFGAGPAPLPTEVLQAAGAALLNYQGQGIGLAEMSHRSPQAAAVLRDAKSQLADFMSIPDDYDILFTQAGGTGQFSCSLYFMLAIWAQRQIDACDALWASSPHFQAPADGEARLAEVRKVIDRTLRVDYLVTGSWSLKASQEAARLLGSEHVHIVADSRQANNGAFGQIPPESAWNLDRPSKFDAGAEPQQSVMTYYCDNETVDGVEFPGFPAALESPDGHDDRLVVADMSSNILSRRVDISKYAAIFAGAQKNIATPGITIVIVRKALLAHKTPSPDTMRKLGLPVAPIALEWATIAKNNSLYNTLPIFDVWVAGQVVSRLLKQHGERKIEGQEALANEKAAKVYGRLDAHRNLYKVVPDRCLSNEEDLLAAAKERGLTGIKGHRSVGGLRVSNYNAVSMESIDELCAFLKDFSYAAKWSF